MGFVVWLPAGHPSASPGTGRFLYGSLLASPELLATFSRNHSLIGQLELLAAAAVYSSLASDLADRDVIHFIDNSSALYGLVKGYSPKPDSERIIRAFHVLNVAVRSNIWFNYVATKANVADLPSREAFPLLFSILKSFLPSFSPRGDKRDMVLPDMPPLEDASWEDFLSAALEAAQPRPSRSPGRKRARGTRKGTRWQ
jgi:hypothetical protein